MEQLTKPLPLRRLIREKAEDSGDPVLAVCARRLHLLLMGWMILRFAASAAQMLHQQNLTQLAAILITIVFVKITYVIREIAVLSLIGGIATVLQVFLYGLLEGAVQSESLSLLIAIFLVVLAGLFQTAAMLYILFSPGMKRYYAFAKEVQTQWRAQVEAYAQRRGQR